MSVRICEKRPTKSVAIGDIAGDTLPSVMTSVRACFAVPVPKMNVDDCERKLCVWPLDET